VKALDPNVDSVLMNQLPNASNVSAIPLVAEGETVGVLVCSWGANNKRRITQPMIDLMSNVAGRVALSLSNTFLLAEVQRLASVDGLTNLPNRRTFNQAIEREVSRAQRNGQPVSLLMLDIDHFKLVNDQYGHQMGDTVLAESAAGVMEACRGEDLPARYGGEEIVVIMPNCSADQALEAADRIRRALGDANVALPGTHASGGVATFPTHADDVAGLLAAADEALYQSKENGRDRCTLSAREGTLTLNTNVHTS
jgi:two-component system cell cycle response regulator